MKIVFFDEDKNVVEILEDLTNVKTNGLEEVFWNNGGMNFIENYYVILEDNQNFEDLTDQELLDQYKLQVIYSLAKNFESKRLDYLVQGNLDEKQAQFETDKIEINNSTNNEEVNEAYHLALSRNFE